MVDVYNMSVAIFLASNNFWTGSVAVLSSCCIGVTIDSKWLCSNADACFTVSALLAFALTS